MNIEIVKVGFLETNCYILSKENEVLVIDPGDEINKIKSFINNRKVVGILITHNHFDHTGALNYLVDYSKSKVYDGYNLKEGNHNISNFSFDVIETKGHTSDSISFYFKDINSLFCGDFIFYGSVGRTDLGGNYDDMILSINKIKKYNNMDIYPGHGPKTTLDYEKEYNEYFNIDKK